MQARLLRVGAIVVGVVLVAGIGWIARGAWQGSSDTDPSGATGSSIVRVTRGPIEQIVRARGIVKPAPNALVRVGFPMPKDVSRRIRSLRVIEGDTVIAGALLAELDTADLAASLQQLRGETAVILKRLEALRALEPRDMQLAETVRDQAAAQAELASRNLERGTQLKVKSLLPEQELEVLASDAKVARARLANTEAALTQLATKFKTDIATLEAQLQQAHGAVRNAEVQMEWGALRAPFDAVVFAVHQRSGELSSNQPGAPVLTLLKADELQVHLYVDEADFGKVRTGQPVSLQIEAHPGESVKGTIVRVLPQPILQENVVYYLALVEVDAARRGLLRAEMTALAFIETGRGDPVLWVPSAAVRSRNGVWFVSRRGPDGSVETPVQIGMRNEGRVEIRSGLAEGAEVIVP